ncbi:MAG: hypothetical protein ACI9CD_000261 [Candidatus Deianiraeaceae bacterium]|jgi:hypothetical protein
MALFKNNRQEKQFRQLKVLQQESYSNNTRKLRNNCGMEAFGQVDIMSTQ